MSLVNRILNGTTTVKDADDVQELIRERNSRVSAATFWLISAGVLLVGLAVGGLFF